MQLQSSPTGGPQVVLLFSDGDTRKQHAAVDLARSLLATVHSAAIAAAAPWAAATSAPAHPPASAPMSWQPGQQLFAQPDAGVPRPELHAHAPALANGAGAPPGASSHPAALGAVVPAAAPRGYGVLNPGGAIHQCGVPGGQSAAAPPNHQWPRGQLPPGLPMYAASGPAPPGFAWPAAPAGGPQPVHLAGPDAPPPQSSAPAVGEQAAEETPPERAPPKQPAAKRKFKEFKDEPANAQRKVGPALGGRRALCATLLLGLSRMPCRQPAVVWWLNTPCFQLSHRARPVLARAVRARAPRTAWSIVLAQPSARAIAGAGAAVLLPAPVQCSSRERGDGSRRCAARRRRRFGRRARGAIACSDWSDLAVASASSGH